MRLPRLRPAQPGALRRHSTQPTVLSAHVVPAPALHLTRALAGPADSSPPDFPPPHPRAHALRNGDAVPPGWEPLWFHRHALDPEHGHGGALREFLRGRTFWNPVLPLKFGADARCFVRRIGDDGEEREVGGREGWSVREWRSGNGEGEEVEAAEEATNGVKVFERAFVPPGLLGFRFAALTYNADRRFWDPSLSDDGSTLLDPDLLLLLLLDAVHQFRPTLAPSRMDFSLPTPLRIPSQPSPGFRISIEGYDTEDPLVLGLVARQAGTVGARAKLTCVEKEAARAAGAGGKPVSGLARMVRWE